MSKKIKWIDRCLIESYCYIGLCTSKAQFYREMRRLNIKKRDRPEYIPSGKDGSTYWLRKKKDGKELCIVCIGSGKHDPNELIGLIIHESVHVWQSIRKSISEDSPSAEFEAYAIQTIAQRLIEAYGKC